MVYAFETKTRYQNVVCATWHGPFRACTVIIITIFRASLFRVRACSGNLSIFSYLIFTWILNGGCNYRLFQTSKWGWNLPTPRPDGREFNKPFQNVWFSPDESLRSALIAVRRSRVRDCSLLLPGVIHLSIGSYSLPISLRAVPLPLLQLSSTSTDLCSPDLNPSSVLDEDVSTARRSSFSGRSLASTVDIIGLSKVALVLSRVLV